MGAQRESNTSQLLYPPLPAHSVINIYARAEKNRFTSMLSMRVFPSGNGLVWFCYTSMFVYESSCKSGSPLRKRQAKIKIKIPAPVGRCLFPWWRRACADVYDDLTHAYSPHMPLPPLSRWRQSDCLHTAPGAITWWDPRIRTCGNTGEHLRVMLLLILWACEYLCKNIQSCHFTRFQTPLWCMVYGCCHGNTGTHVVTNTEYSVAAICLTFKMWSCRHCKKVKAEHTKTLLLQKEKICYNKMSNFMFLVAAQPQA